MASHVTPTWLTLSGTTNDHWWTGRHWEQPRTRGWGGSTLCIAETKTDGIERSEKRLHTPHCPSPRPAQPHTVVSPEPPGPPARKGRGWGEKPARPALWVTVWEPLLQSRPTGLAQWESACDREGAEGLATTSTWTWAKFVPAAPEQ